MKVKLVISIILLSLAFLFVFQNTEMVEIDFLAWSVQFSLALLILFAFAAGLAIAWIMSSYLHFSRNRKKTKEGAKGQTGTAAVNQVATSSPSKDIKIDAQED